jgi:hypothetical protein
VEPKLESTFDVDCASTFEVDSKKCPIRSVDAMLESTFDVDDASTFEVDSKKCPIRSVEPKLESTFDVDDASTFEIDLREYKKSAIFERRTSRVKKICVGGKRLLS